MIVPEREKSLILSVSLVVIAIFLLITTAPIGFIYAIIYEGYKKGLAKAGIEYDPSLVEHSSNTYSSSAAMTERLMHRRRDIDAIFAANDEMAFAAIQTLKELNYSVGSDILVIGFDNTNRAMQTFPNITTIGQDYEKIGENLVTGLLKKMNGEKILSKKVAPKLILRGSA